MTEPVTKRDLSDQNFEKVFPNGPQPMETPQQASRDLVTIRPGYTVDAKELEAAKMMSMGRVLTPAWLQTNPGDCWSVIQLAKRWSRYDPSTNSWITFDPAAIAACIYPVEQKSGVTYGYTSQFIGALVDAFAGCRLRFRYEGEGQNLTCTCWGLLGRDPEPFEYTTPPLSKITPKRSQLWESDPPRQLAYYARRAWARLYTPAVLLGVYDVDELEGRIVHKVRDLNPISGADGLHERLAMAAAASQGEREGFSAKAIENVPPWEEAAGDAEGVGGDIPTPGDKKRASGLRTVTVTRSKAGRPPKGPEKEPAEPLPTNAKQYREYVTTWLAEYDNEEKIEGEWRKQMKLRNFCGVVEEDRAAIRLLVDARISELRR